MTKIKFCGIKRPEDIDYCNQLKPDYVGFIFAKSKRQIDHTTAKKLRKELNPNIPAVGVFVDEEPIVMAELANSGVIQYIQLHGSEDRKTIQKLRQLTTAPLIKALAIRDKESFNIDFDVDYYLYDSYDPNLAGGTGKAFNWDLIKNRPSSHLNKPFFLAGGLNSHNITEAIASTKPFGIDLSSGTETNGVKDFDKMQKIIDLIRN